MTVKNELIVFLTVMTVVAAMSVAPIFAAEPNGASVSGDTDMGDWPDTAAGTVDLISGGIHRDNLSIDSPTYLWTGVFGTANGNIRLGDQFSGTMYSWAADGKWVYFNDDATIDWGGTPASASCANIISEFSFLSGAGNDNCTATFTTTNDYQSDLTGWTVNSANTAQTNPGSSWNTSALIVGADVFFVGGIVPDAGQASYNGTLANYQVILPEDGLAGDANVTQYYIWLELE